MILTENVTKNDSVNSSCLVLCMITVDTEKTWAQREEAANAFMA
jgi:hypothetical protein